MRDTLGWIIVRVMSTGDMLPQTVTGVGHKVRDALEVTDTTIFTDPGTAELTLQRVKLGRPDSQLELRRCSAKLEIMDL